MKRKRRLPREDRELLLSCKANPDPKWLSKLARRIVQSDPCSRTLAEWLRAQGTGPPHVQPLTFLLEGPEPRVCRVTEFQQTEKEYVFLRALLSFLAEGYDVRELLEIEPHKVGHRKPDPLAASIAAEVELRVEEGDPVGKAIKDVARIARRTEMAVRAIRQRSKCANNR